jgi:hypothetical protein
LKIIQKTNLGSSCESIPRVQKECNVLVSIFSKSIETGQKILILSKSQHVKKSVVGVQYSACLAKGIGYSKKGANRKEALTKARASFHKPKQRKPFREPPLTLHSN